MASVEPRPTVGRLQLVHVVEEASASASASASVSASASASASASEEDQALLQSFRRGDRGTGLLLYRRLVPVVDAALFRVMGRRDVDHADLVQAAFEQIVMTLSKDRFEAKCSLSSWASVIACHVGLTALRSQRRRRGVIANEVDPERLAEDAGSAPSNPERQVAAQRELSVLRGHLAEMEEDRTTALLLYAMGHSIKEIALLTNVSVAAAQSRLSRGRRELQDRLRGTSARSEETEPAGQAVRGR